MRHTSQILIYIDVQAALDAGIKFFVSDNGVILTPGNEKGILEPRFFLRTEEKAKAPKKPVKPKNEGDKITTAEAPTGESTQVAGKET